MNASPPFFLDQLKSVTRSTSGWQACCPSHEDKKPSLSIGFGTDGRILLKCQAGCTLDAVLSALRISAKDLFPKAGPQTQRQIVATYDYRDEAGELLFQVVRFEPKDFRQRTPDPSAKDGWNWSAKNVRRVPYRLGDIAGAFFSGEPVIICEGEKDADALAAKGFVATCNPGGAGKWLDEYSEALRGARVYIVPDNDKPGKDHAAKVLESLKGVAEYVRIAELPTEVSGRKVKDAADFFAAGGTVEQFQQCLTDETPALIRKALARRFDLSNKPPTVEPVYFAASIPIATAGNIVTINAHVKSGKSTLIEAMIAAPMAIAGSDTLGISSRNPNSFALLHVDTEQCPEDHYAQLARALRRAGRERTPEWIQSFCLTGWPALEIWDFIKEAARFYASQFGGLHSIHCDGVADLICDVNDAAESNGLVTGIHALAIELHCPFLGAIHFNPGSEKTRGHLGSQLERKAESNLRLDKDASEIIELWSSKQRRAPILKGKGPRFQWSDDAGMHVSVESAHAVRDTEKTERLTILRDDVFGDRSAMRYCDIISTLKSEMKMPEKTAERKFTELRKHTLIKRDGGIMWNKNDLA